MKVRIHLLAELPEHPRLIMFDADDNADVESLLNNNNIVVTHHGKMQCIIPRERVHIIEIVR